MFARLAGRVYVQQEFPNLNIWYLLFFFRLGRRKSLMFLRESSELTMTTSWTMSSSLGQPRCRAKENFTKRKNWRQFWVKLSLRSSSQYPITHKIFVCVRLGCLREFAESRKVQSAMEKCHFCFDNVPKHLIIAIGLKVKFAFSRKSLTEAQTNVRFGCLTTASVFGPRLQCGCACLTGVPLPARSPLDG